MVVGSINRDLVTHVDRLPGPSETVLGRRERVTSLGGKGANQAVAAARLGATVEMVGAVAEADRDELRSELSGHGVATTWLIASSEPTGWAHILVDAAGDNLIVVDPGANETLTEAHVASAVRSAHPAVVLTQCEIGPAVAAKALQLGRSIGATTICNASPALDLGIFNAADIDVLIVNRTEAELMAHESQPDRAARMLSARTGGTAVVTLGANGLIVASAGDVTAMPAVPAPTVRDTTGAGDVFAGAFARGIALGQAVTDALDLARRAASWTVAHLGTLGPQPADL